MNKIIIKSSLRNGEMIRDEDDYVLVNELFSIVILIFLSLHGGYIVTFVFFGFFCGPKHLGLHLGLLMV